MSALTEQQAQHKPVESAVLLVGPAGMPYIASRLAVSQIIRLDISQEALDIASRRQADFLAVGDWEEFLDAEVLEIPGCLNEYDRMERAGLCTAEDLIAGQLCIGEVNVTEVCADILQAGPAIQAILERTGTRLSFAHTSNVGDLLFADEIPYDIPIGNRLMASMLEKLPIADDIGIFFSYDVSLADHTVLEADFTDLDGLRGHTPSAARLPKFDKTKPILDTLRLAAPE